MNPCERYGYMLRHHSNNLRQSHTCSTTAITSYSSTVSPVHVHVSGGRVVVRVLWCERDEKALIYVHVHVCVCVVYMYVTFATDILSQRLVLTLSVSLSLSLSHPHSLSLFLFLSHTLPLPPPPIRTLSFPLFPYPPSSSIQINTLLLLLSVLKSIKKPTTRVLNQLAV